MEVANLREEKEVCEMRALVRGQDSREGGDVFGRRITSSPDKAHVRFPVPFS